MRNNRLFRPIVQVLVILVAIGLLFHFWHANPPLPVPVGGGDNDEDDVKYSPIVPVSVAPITVATVRSYILAYGTVEPAPAAQGKPAAGATIRVPASALVAEVNCTEGQHVEQGQLLFKLDDRVSAVAIGRSQKQLDIANQNLEQFSKDANIPGQYRLRAQRERAEAQAALDSVTAQQALLSFNAPISGTVLQLNIRTGELADPSTTAVQIVDLSRVVIALNIPGWQLHEMRVGQDVEIIHHGKQIQPDGITTAPTTQTNSTIGKVILVDPQVDPSTGMGSVDVAPPPDLELRPGEFVTVRIISQEHKDCLTVPAISLVKDANDIWGVSVAVGDFHRAFRHPVKVGLIEGERAEIQGEGIAAGSFVVTTGAHALPDKSKIEISK